MQSRAEYAREYRLRNLEKAREYARNYARETRKRWSPEKRAEVATKKRAYNQAHKEERKAYRLKYEATHARKQRKYENNRERVLRYKYGLTVENLEKLTAAANQTCWACGGNDSNRPLCVDHVEVADKPVVRGILCWHCNVVLGLLKDDIRRLSSLAKYVEGEIAPDLREVLLEVRRS